MNIEANMDKLNSMKRKYPTTCSAPVDKRMKSDLKGLNLLARVASLSTHCHIGIQTKIGPETQSKQVQIDACCAGFCHHCRISHIQYSGFLNSKKKIHRGVQIKAPTKNSSTEMVQTDSNNELDTSKSSTQTIQKEIKPVTTKSSINVDNLRKMASQLNGMTEPDFQTCTLLLDFFQNFGFQTLPSESPFESAEIFTIYQLMRQHVNRQCDHVVTTSSLFRFIQWWKQTCIASGMYDIDILPLMAVLTKTDHRYNTNNTDVSDLMTVLSSMPQSEVNLILGSLLCFQGDNDKQNLDKCIDDLHNNLASIAGAFKVISKSKVSNNVIVTAANAISSGRFPLFSVMYSFINEQFLFYLQKSTTTMSYSDITKTFFKVTRDIFGGAVTRFFRSWGHEGQGKTGTYDPEEAEICFAIPCESTLQNHLISDLCVPDRMKPGINQSLVHLYMKESPSQCYILKLDGRRIRPGFDGDIGDVNYDDGATEILFQKQQQQILHVESMSSKLTNGDVSSVSDPSFQSCICDVITDIQNLNISNQLQLVSKKKRLISLENRISEDLDDFKQKNQVLNLRSHCAKLTENNLQSLTVCEQLANMLATSARSPIDLVEMKSVVNGHIPLGQRSEDWFSLRKQFSVTGSKLYDTLGFGGSGKRTKMYDEYHRGKAPKDLSSDPRIGDAVRHGALHEKDAVATICQKVIPIFFPNLTFATVGSFSIPEFTTKHSHDANYKCFLSDNDQDLCLVSPDGVLVDQHGVPKIVVEIKCPFFFNKPHLEVPERYVPQLMAEASASQCDQILYVSWTNNTTTLFLGSRNDQFLSEMMHEILTSFVEGARKEKSENSVKLKDKCKQIAKTFSFLAEVFSISAGFPSTTPDDPTIISVKTTIANTKTLMKECHLLQRQMATESVTFLFSNTDRCNPTVGHGVPAAQVLSHPSSPIHKTRIMCNRLIVEVFRQDGHIVAVCFDGAYHSLLSYGHDGKPKTELTLARLVFRAAQKCTKSKILEIIQDTKSGEMIMQGQGHHLDDVLDVPDVPDDVPDDSEDTVIINPDEPSRINETRLLTHLVSKDDIQLLRVSLHSNCKFHSLTDDDLLQALGNESSLKKCTIPQLKEIIKWVKSLSELQDKRLKISGNKQELIDRLNHVLEINETGKLVLALELSPIPSLSSLAMKKCSSLSKHALNILVSDADMKFAYENWKNSSPISFNIHRWFYVPDIHPQTGEPILYIEDTHHLCIRFRTCILKGTPTFIDCKGFHSIAESRQTRLTPAMMSGIDIQSEEYARILFSEEVEGALLNINMKTEGTFCRLFRGFMKANDEPGIPAHQRIALRQELKEFLLQGVDLSSFPPPGRYVKGIPTVLFESIIANIDAHYILHALVPGGKINPRSVGTNDNETYHSIEESLCKSWGGIPSATELEHVKHKAALMCQLILQKNKLFPFRHSKKVTYPHLPQVCSDTNVVTSPFKLPNFIAQITPSDHEFDINPSKNRNTPKLGITEWHKPAKGVRPIRQFYRVDESSLPYSDRGM